MSDTTATTPDEATVITVDTVTPHDFDTVDAQVEGGVNL